MAFIPTANAIELVIHFTMAGIPCSLTLTLGNGGVPPSTTDLEDAALMTNGWVAATLVDWLSGDVAFNGVTAYDLTSASSPLHNVVNSPAIAGEVAEDSVPSNVAIVSSLRTGNRGRSSRGRNYVAGIPVGQVLDPSHSTTTFATNILGAYVTLLAASALAGFTNVVNSKYTLGAPRTAGFIQEIESIVVNNEFDTKDRTAA